MKMSGDAFAFTEDLDAVSTDFSLADSFKKKTTSTFSFIFFNKLQHFPQVVKMLYVQSSCTTPVYFNPRSVNKTFFL